MSVRRKFSFEGKIALLAVATSIGALCISGYQAYMQRLQTYASVLPSITATTSYHYISNSFVGNTFDFIIENKGVGPAKIDSVEFYFEGKRYSSFVEIIKKIKVMDIYSSNELWKNRMISANEQIATISIKDSLAKIISDKFLQNKKPSKLELTIIYSSIFDEKWKLKWTNINNKQSIEKL